MSARDTGDWIIATLDYLVTDEKPESLAEYVSKPTLGRKAVEKVNGLVAALEAALSRERAATDLAGQVIDDLAETCDCSPHVEAIRVYREKLDALPAASASRAATERERALREALGVYADLGGDTAIEALDYDRRLAARSVGEQEAEMDADDLADALNDAETMDGRPGSVRVPGGERLVGEQEADERTEAT